MFRRKTMAEIEESSGRRAGAKRRRILVALEDVRSMNNVGSVFRSCDAFGVEELWLCGFTPTPPHRDIQKTALGASETVKWRHFPSSEEMLEAATAAGLTVAAAEQAAESTSLEMAFSTNEAKSVLLVFGNEVDGVSDAILEVADVCVEIPQVGAKHSLNIAVSVGVVLWEAVRGAATSQP